MASFDPLIVALASVTLASILAHIFAMKRSRNEYRLKKLEELLTALHQHKLVFIEMYEFYLACAQRRKTISDHMSLRNRGLEIGMKYNMPHFTMISLAEIYFPKLCAPIVKVTSTTSALAKIDAKLSGREQEDLDYESQGEINRFSSQFQKYEEELRTKIRKTAAVLRCDLIGVFRRDKPVAKIFREIEFKRE